MHLSLWEGSAMNEMRASLPSALARRQSNAVPTSTPLYAARWRRRYANQRCTNASASARIAAVSRWPTA